MYYNLGSIPGLTVPASVVCSLQSSNLCQTSSAVGLCGSVAECCGKVAQIDGSVAQCCGSVAQCCGVMVQWKLSAAVRGSVAQWALVTPHGGPVEQWWPSAGPCLGWPLLCCSSGQHLGQSPLGYNNSLSS